MPLGWQRPGTAVGPGGQGPTSPHSSPRPSLDSVPAGHAARSQPRQGRAPPCPLTRACSLYPDAHFPEPSRSRPGSVFGFSFVPCLPLHSGQLPEQVERGISGDQRGSVADASQITDAAAQPGIPQHQNHRGTPPCRSACLPPTGCGM